MTRWLSCVAVMLASAACDGEIPADAGVDAALDAGRDAGRDAGPAPMCEPACETPETCCVEPEGTQVCANLRNDPRHCGLCQIDCIDSHRGDGCSASQCTCGTSRLGCTGNRQSWCCPPRPGTGTSYCTDLDRSAADCGSCGNGCDLRVADRCDGGRCVCGGTRGACAGTPDSLCCMDGADVGCVDTTSDPFHCGACNNRCAGSERCVGGTCTEGVTECTGGCDPGAVCCNGTCCTALGRCIEGVCASSSRRDGGTPDAGP